MHRSPYFYIRTQPHPCSKTTGRFSLFMLPRISVHTGGTHLPTYITSPSPSLLSPSPQAVAQQGFVSPRISEKTSPRVAFNVNSEAQTIDAILQRRKRISRRDFVMRATEHSGPL